MNVLHRALHLQHHAHTGKVLHHRHTSYRGLALLFIVAAISMWGLSALSKATADTIFGVSGTVLAPVPHAAASIMTPANGTKLTNASTIVVGSCPLITPQVNVVVLADGIPVGSAICDANNDFTVPVTLEAGIHNLVAQTYTLTGQEGPASTSVNVQFAATSVANSPSLSADQPLSFLSGQSQVEWTGTISGGTAPYTLRIDWGDGTHKSVPLTAPGSQHLSFTYANATPHNMTLLLTDASGRTTMQQYAVAAYAAVSAPASVANTDNEMMNARTVAGLYGLFVTVMAVTVIVAIEGHKARVEHRFAS